MIIFLSTLLTLLLVAIDPVYGFSMMIAPTQYSTSSLRTTDSYSPYEQNCKRSLSLSFLPKSNHQHFMVTKSTNRNWNLDKSALCMSSISNNDLSSSPLKIIISGAPASGKGTQCENIIDNYGVVHLSTGDILRKAVSDGTEVGLLAKQFMDQGQLVPDHVIISIVRFFIVVIIIYTIIFFLILFVSQFSFFTLFLFRCLSHLIFYL